jgi:hypothetical protein
MNTDTALTAPAGLNPAQAMILSQRTPADAIRYRQGRGGSQRLAYVSHAWVTRVLNEAFGFRWSWDVTDTVIVPDLTNPAEVIVRGRLTVTTPDGGTVVKEQFGSTDVKRYKNGGVISLGDDLKAASSDALKKAASLLGVALDLYGASDDPLPGEEPATRPAGGATKAAGERKTQNSTTKAHNGAQRAPQSATTATSADAEFDKLPSASTAPAQAAALAKNGNGSNGHRPARPTWAGPDDAKTWAAKQTNAAGVLIFAHANHVANAYDKLRRAYTAEAEHPTPAGFFDRWFADVQRRIDEANAKLDAELDAAAAAEEQPHF